MRIKLLLVFVLVLVGCQRKANENWLLYSLALYPPSEAAIGPDGISAAVTTAENSADCQSIFPFYWEIGDGSGVIVSGSSGDGSVGAGDYMLIASASKWVWAAYVAESVGSFSGAETNSLRMLSGYTLLTESNCSATASATVNDCFIAGTNNTHTPAHDGKFYYDGGHFQAYAVNTAGLGSLTHSTLADEVQLKIGSEIPIGYVKALPAGGMLERPIDYAAFLRKIINNNLAIHNLLGVDPVCTLPSSCPDDALYSPVPEAWEYSYGHWVEKSGDNAFSSPGKYGFYPWIDSTVEHYGVVARFDASLGAYWDSVKCGRLIRRAFDTGIVQQ